MLSPVTTDRARATSQVEALLRAAHPAPALAVTTFFGLLGAGAGLRGGRLGLLAAAAAAGQLSVGWANDWVDAGRDRAVLRADKPVATGATSVGAVRAAAFTALIVCTGLSLGLGLEPGLAHLAAVAAAWAYDLGLKATPVSVVPYLLAFGLVPVVVAGTAGGTAPWWMVTAGALLGGGGHFANAAADLDEDARTGVRGLPQRLGRAASLAAAGLLLACGVALVVAYGGLSGPTRLLLAGAGAVATVTVLVLGLRPGSRGAFGAAIATAAVAVGGVLGAADALGR